MGNENQFISDYSTHPAGTELFTPILLAVGILSLCICGWRYYLTPQPEDKVIHQGIIWVQSAEGERQLSTSVDLGTSIDLQTYAEALHFPDFDTLLSHNLYAHLHATNISGPECGRTFCELTALKPITSYVEHLTSPLLTSDFAPDLVNAWESGIVAKLRQSPIQINTHLTCERVLWAVESVNSSISPISQSLFFSYTEQIRAFNFEITQIYITLTQINLSPLEGPIRCNSLGELFKGLTTTFADYPQNLINDWNDWDNASVLEPHVLVSLLTSIVLIKAIYKLNLRRISHLEIKVLNSLTSRFRALLGCVYPALLEANLLNPLFINRNLSEELEKFSIFQLSIFQLSIFHKTHKNRFSSIRALFNIE